MHVIPSHELSGVVMSVGKGAQSFAVSDEVYGMSDWFEQGATAEFCLALPSGIALKPSRLSDTEAAAIPIAALTAWQGHSFADSTRMLIDSSCMVEQAR